jgi:hypothetical protein
MIVAARQRVGPIQRRLVEGVDRHEPGRILPRVEVLVVGRTIQVDDVARMRRHQDRRAKLRGESVQPLEVPVAIVDEARVRRHRRGDVVGDVGARMRNRDQQRQRALLQREYSRLFSHVASP